MHEKCAFMLAYKFLISDQYQQDDLRGYAVWDLHIPLKEETAALAEKRSLGNTRSQ